MRNSEKKLTGSSKKVAEIRRVLCDNSNNKLAEMLGTTPQIVSNLVSGRRNLGMRTAEKILAAFPQLSREWLYTGDGPMLVSADNGSQVINGDGNHHNAVNSVDDRLLAIIETDQRERMELLAIIRNLTDPKQ